MKPPAWCGWIPLLLLGGQGALACKKQQEKFQDIARKLSSAADRGLRSEREKEFNLTTISPDDETIDSLIDAVDSAVGTLQSAIDYPDYPVEPGSLDSGEAQPDQFTGENDYYQDEPPDPGDYEPGNDYYANEEDYNTGNDGNSEDANEDYEIGTEDDYGVGNEEDYVNGNDYDSEEDYSSEYEGDEDYDEEEEDDDAIVIEEATAGASVYNSTVSFTSLQFDRKSRSSILSMNLSTANHDDYRTFNGKLINLLTMSGCSRQNLGTNYVGSSLMKKWTTHEEGRW